VSEAIRSFIAVVVPPASAENLREAQDRLRSGGEGVKWVDPDGFHITLKFLGSVELERLRTVWRSVSEALDGSRPFGMHFRGVGAFPSRDRARVVWAGMDEGAEELAALAAKVEEACAEHGFERENRPFRAHMTLGRVRRPRPNPKLADVMRTLADADLGEVQVDRVVLMRSELTRAGAIYHPVDQKELGEGEVT
jgi:2'-5' RNA ligase